MMLRGVRGATTVVEDTQVEVLRATKELLLAMVERNGIDIGGIASVFFSLSPDLHSVFPAEAAREIEGWRSVPLFCAQEVDVVGGMKSCVRVLIHWNTTRAPEQIRHVYLAGAVKLRPDLQAGV